MKKRLPKTPRSLVTTLSLAVVLIFILMIFLFNFLLNTYQVQTMVNYGELLEASLESTGMSQEQTILLVLEEQEIQSTTEFQSVTIAVSILVLGLGVAAFVGVIRRQLQPREDLAETVSHIDMGKVQAQSSLLQDTPASKEIHALALGLDEALGRISDSYDQQRRFSLDLAHEIRTPLAVMASQLELFSRQAQTGQAEVESLVAGFRMQIDRLSDLVDALLLLRTDQPLSLQPLSLRPLLDEMLYDLEEMAQERKVEVRLDGEDLTVSSDDQLLQRALYNLIDNAIKYSPPGGEVRVGTYREGTWVRIRVADQGPGIPPEMADQVYDLFFRMDPSRSRGSGGYGIGLALVQHIAHRLGGQIDFENLAPHGACFTLSLPSE